MNHFSMAHQQARMQQHRCNRCQRTFDKQSTLMKHLIRPTRCHPSSYVVCDKCKNTYASKQSLSNHKRKCNGLGIHFCDKCKRFFSSSQALTSHKRWKCKQPAAFVQAASGIKLQRRQKDKVSTVITTNPNNSNNDTPTKPKKTDTVNDIEATNKPDRQKKTDIDGTYSVSPILDRIIKPVTTLTDEERRNKDRNDKEKEVITIINNLDDVYKSSSLVKMLKSLKSSNVKNNELILPKILDILQTLPSKDRFPLERFVYEIDQIRVEALIKAVFTYVTKHDREELLEMVKQFKKKDIDVSHLKDLLLSFFEKEYDENDNELLPQVSYIIRNLPELLKTDQLRFEILLKDLEDNRYRIKRILRRLNQARSEENYVNQLHSLAREKFLSGNEFDELYSTKDNRDISNIANIIKLTKIGRGVKFLPRTKRGLYHALNSIYDDSKSILKKDLFAVLDELLHRKAIPEKDYQNIRKAVE